MEYWWSMTGIFMQWRNVFRLPMDKDGIWVGSSSHIFYQNHCGNASSVRILWTYNHTTIFSRPNLTFKYFQNCLQLQLTLCETRGNMMFMWIMKSTKSTKGWDAMTQIPGSSWQEANGLTLFTDFTTFLAPFAKRSHPAVGPWLVKKGHATMEENYMKHGSKAPQQQRFRDRFHFQRVKSHSHWVVDW